MSVMSKGICTTWWHVHCQNLQVDHFQGESQYTLILQIHTHTLINYFFDTRICTILTLRRFPPSPSQSLFLASTVSTMHTNSHIWNASHPLVVTYYCWVAVYSPIMKAKKKVMCQPLGVELPMSVMGLILPTSLLILHSKPDGTSSYLVKRRLSKLQITTCAENGKNQLTSKRTNHLFTYYLNCTCKSNPVF